MAEEYQTCGQVEHNRSMTERRAAKRAKCNRTAGHPGPHRKYDIKATVLAEWEDQ